MARAPATASASEARITMERLRTDHSMIDSIMALPLGSMSMDARGRGDDGPGYGVIDMSRLVTARMHRSGRRVEAALGVDQEGALRGDLLAGGEPFEDREAVADAGAQDD